MLHFGFDIFASSKILRILELICKYTNLWLKAFETPSSRSLVRVSAVDCSKYKSFFFFFFLVLRGVYHRIFFRKQTTVKDH